MGTSAAASTAGGWMACTSAGGWTATSTTSSTTRRAPPGTRGRCGRPEPSADGGVYVPAREQHRGVVLEHPVLVLHHCPGHAADGLRRRVGGRSLALQQVDQPVAPEGGAVRVA